MKATQRILQCIVVLLIILTVFQACKKQKSDLSGTYSVRLSNQTQIPSSGGVYVVLLDITDSRCPSNAVCTTAGTAVATVLIHDTDQEKTIKLYLSGSSLDPQTSEMVTINGKNYLMKLLEVTPYPGSSIENKAKKAVFQLSTN